MRTVAAMIAGLLLAGPALALPVQVNPFNQRMKALSLADRNGALRRAVTLEDLPCGRLGPSLDRGMYGNLGLWQVRCTPGGDYGVFVGPDGEVQVRSCADMKDLKLPQCVAMKADVVPAPTKRRAH